MDQLQKLIVFPEAVLIAKYDDIVAAAGGHGQGQRLASVPLPKRPAREPGEVLRDQREEPQPDAAMNILDAMPAGVRAVANAAVHVAHNGRRGSREVIAVLVQEQSPERWDQERRQLQ